MFLISVILNRRKPQFSMSQTKTSLILPRREKLFIEMDLDSVLIVLEPGSPIIDLESFWAHQF